MPDMQPASFSTGVLPAQSSLRVKQEPTHITATFDAHGRNGTSHGAGLASFRTHTAKATVQKKKQTKNESKPVTLVSIANSAIQCNFVSNAQAYTYLGLRLSEWEKLRADNTSVKGWRVQRTDQSHSTAKKPSQCKAITRPEPAKKDQIRRFRDADFFIHRSGVEVLELDGGWSKVTVFVHKKCRYVALWHGGDVYEGLDRTFTLDGNGTIYDGDGDEIVFRESRRNGDSVASVQPRVPWQDPASEESIAKRDHGIYNDAHGGLRMLPSNVQDQPRRHSQAMRHTQVLGSSGPFGTAEGKTTLPLFTTMAT